MRFFHFTFGPIQGFIAQARRTRDLWAGSFLLSWLSGKAMQAVLEQNGRIVFPKVTDDKGSPIDPMLRAMYGDFAGGNYPRVGSIPNRFKAAVEDSFDVGSAEAVADAVQSAWQELAGAVYERFVQPVEQKGVGVKDIWDRQIGNFWEFNWVLGDEPAEPGEDDLWLDLRKNWRSHWPATEGGDHCTVMGDYQELSGYLRVKDREKQDAFWEAVRKKTPGGPLDIRENERLCAIALVKRLFPQLGKNKLEEALGWVPGGKPNAVANWPSTTYMAVAPWLAYLQSEGKYIKALGRYACEAKRTISNFAKRVSEQATYLATLKTLNEIFLCGQSSWKLSDLDGDLLHLHALRNHRTSYLSETPLKPDGSDNNAPQREKLVGALKRLYGEVGRSPRSYYALLLMDGDNLGNMLKNEDSEKVSDALLSFTRKVPGIVDEDERHGGVTIYAGGDDVFALLPLDTAIACALALRRAFGDSFRDVGIEATASCAIVFAHHQAPLRKVIAEAHNQLDEVAKECNGRDSLALAVYKPGGVTAQWVSAWSTGSSPVERMVELVNAMGADLREYPRGLFHKLRDRYGLYEDSDALASGGLNLQQLLVAEYMQSRDREPTRAEAERAVERLMAVCLPLRRIQPRVGGQPQTKQSTSLRLDGGLIARFLTQEED